MLLDMRQENVLHYIRDDIDSDPLPVKSEDAK